MEILENVYNNHEIFSKMEYQGMTPTQYAIEYGTYCSYEEVETSKFKSKEHISAFTHKLEGTFPYRNMSAIVALLNTDTEKTISTAFRVLRTCVHNFNPFLFTSLLFKFYENDPCPICLTEIILTEEEDRPTCTHMSDSKYTPRTKATSKTSIAESGRNLLHIIASFNESKSDNTSAEVASSCLSSQMKDTLHAHFVDVLSHFFQTKYDDIRMEKVKNCVSERVRGVNVFGRILEQKHNGCTPLILACERQKKQLIDTLITAGARCDVQSESDNTPIHYVMSDSTWFERKYPQRLQTLFTGKIRNVVNNLNSKSESPLAICLYYLYSFFLEGATPIEKDNVETIILWLLEEGAQLSSIENYEKIKSSRVVCDSKTLTSFVLNLITNRMDLREGGLRYRWSIIESAVRNGDEVLVKLILDSGSSILPLMVKPEDVEAFNDSENILSEDDEEEKKKKKKKKTASSGLRSMHPDETDGPGNETRYGFSDTLLHIAVECRNRKVEIVEMLLDHNPRDELIAVNLQSMRLTPEEESVIAKCFKPSAGALDRAGRTALHMAAMHPERSRGVSDIADALMKRIDIVKKDPFGWTALHYASDQNQLDIVDRLIASHVDVNVTTVPDTECENLKNNYLPEHTPLHLAARKGNWQIAFSLLKSGADVDVIDDQGRTPLNLAMSEHLRFSRLYSMWKEAYENTGQEFYSWVQKRKMSQVPVPKPKKDRRKSNKVAPSPKGLNDGGFVTSDVTKDEHGVIVNMDFGKGSLTMEEMYQIHKYSMKETEAMVRQYKTTINVLLGQGAQIDKATSEASGFCLDELLDVGAAWSEIHEEVMRLDRRIYELELEEVEKIGVEEDEDANKQEAGEEGVQVKKCPRCNTPNLKHRVDTPLEVQCHLCKGVFCFSCRCPWDTSPHTNYYVCNLVELDSDDQLQKMGVHTERFGPGGRTTTGPSKTAFSSEETGSGGGEESKAPRENRARLLQKKEDIWEDKTNQIVIDHFYNTQVRDRHMVRLFAYFLFLALVTFVAVSGIQGESTSAHYIREDLKAGLDVSELRTIEDFYDWANTSFKDFMYSEEESQYWDDNNELVKRGRGYVREHMRVLGIPRLRMQRRKVFECDVAEEFQSLTKECMTVLQRDSDAFGPGKKYTHVSEGEINGIWVWARMAMYTGSGFIVDLPPPTSNTSRSVFEATIQQLKDDEFFDSRSAVLFLEFPAYVANENDWVWVHVALEQGVMGAIVPSTEVLVITVRRYMSFGDKQLLFLEIVLLIVMISMSPKIFQVCRPRQPDKDGVIRRRCGCQVDAFREIGTLFNVVLIVGFFVCIVMHVTLIGLANNVTYTTDNEFVEIQRIAFLTSAYGSVFSFVVFLCWFKSLEYLSVFRSLARLMIMIRMMTKELVDFAALLFIVVVAFTSAEYIAYGYREEEAFTWWNGFLTRISLTFAGREIVPENQVNRVLGVIYPLLFVFIVSLLLLNLLIAVLTSAYESASDQAGESYWAEWQYKMIIWEYTYNVPLAEKGRFSFDTVMISSIRRMGRGTGACARTLTKMRAPPPRPSIEYKAAP